MTSVTSGTGVSVGDDIFCYTDQIVNVIFIGAKGASEWVLVDAGMPRGGEEIVKVAEERYGAGCRPSAILLTHGHFDHVGGIVHLLETWQVPVYAHPDEFPFLTGAAPYPEPDPTVEGGLLAKISSIYPHEPIDISARLCPLPHDHTLPFLPGWQWVHVPGHAPGQVAFFRERGRIVISADAVITVRQDSFYKVLLQQKEVNGPPVYFTTDWPAAKASAIKIRQLEPRILIPGHGRIMDGDELTQGLDTLIDGFDTIAVPEHGKYVTGHGKA